MPYGEAAPLYRERGWAGVLPIVGKKYGLPVGFTGYVERWPTDSEIAEWIEARGNDNLTLRLPGDVISIDVDAYDGRAGLQTLENAEQQLGGLPATWISTSRDDGSGQRLYRVPAGEEWLSQLGDNVEIVRCHHRHCVTWPSIHPETSRQYIWYRPDHTVSTEPPTPTELTDLPQAWIDHLRAGRAEHRAPDGDMHGSEDAIITDFTGNRIDPHLLLSVGVQPGEQNERLFSYLCSLRARNAHRDEMLVLGMQAVQQMATGEGRDPWTQEDVVEIVDRVRDTYGPGHSRDELTPAQREFIRRFSSGETPRAEEILEAPAIPNASETGNALRFAGLYEDEVRYAGDEKKWYHWDGRRWAEALDAEMLRLTEAIPPQIRFENQGDGPWGRWALRSESIAVRTATLRAATARPELLLLSEQLDANPNLLVLDNGTLDLTLGAPELFRPARQEDLCTQLAAVSYDPEATCERWHEHVWLVSRGDPQVYNYLRRALGYSLTGHISERSFFFLLGNGHNGKNALVEPVVSLLGTYGATGTAELLASGSREHPTIVADLRGKRLVFVDELPDRRTLNVERLKSLTGTAQLKARLMGKDYFTFDNQLKLWLTCNGEPPIPDDSEGVWDRMQLVNCRAKFGEGGRERIRDYGKLLYHEEAPGILRWLLTGLREWQQLEELAPPAGVREAVREYRGEEQHVIRWIAQALVRATDPTPEENFISFIELMTNWRAWAGFNGIPKSYVEAVTPTRLGRVLTDYGFNKYQLRASGVVVSGRKGVRFAGDTWSRVEA